MTDSLKRTPLYDWHVQAGAKCAAFAGFEMPIRYGSIVEEHLNVRNACGAFDVSHMGEIFVEGERAEEFLDYITPNAVKKLVDGKAQYTALTMESGGVVDDVIIYRFSPSKFLICVNASNIEKDFKWISGQNNFDCDVRNESENYGQIAFQGPKAVALVSELCGVDLNTQVPFFCFTEMELFGAQTIVARTGYTGEDGFELFIPKEKTLDVWQAAFELAEKFTLKPVGLGARDTLRLEACFPLYGHELREDVSAVESGIGWVVKHEKGDFLGCEILAKHKTEGAPRKLVGLEIIEPGIAREESKIFLADDTEVGVVTSGTMSPSFEKAIALALVKTDQVSLDDELFVQVRSRKLKAKVVKKPFYKR